MPTPEANRQFAAGEVSPRVIAARVQDVGFVFISRCRPDLATEVLAATVGVRDAIADVPPVQRLTPKTVAESPPNLYSGEFGYGTFPLHTDLAHWFVPPRFILLRCVRGDDRVGTSVISFESALSGLPSAIADRARFRPRRPLNGRVPLLAFRQRQEGMALCRWDGLFLRPDNADAEAVAQHLGRLQARATEGVVLGEPGDTLIIDNWRALHGRSSVPDGASSRLLERMYLRELRQDG